MGRTLREAVVCQRFQAALQSDALRYALTKPSLPPGKSKQFEDRIFPAPEIPAVPKHLDPRMPRSHAPPDQMARPIQYVSEL